MSADAPAEPHRRQPRTPRRRRPLWVLTGLVLAALTCFLIAVAAGLISDKVSSSTLDASTPTVTTSGRQLPTWPRPASFVGRYRLNVVPASAGTTSTGGSTAATGDLSLFLRTIKSTEPLALSGILSIKRTTGEQLVYLTNLTSRQGALHADINGGSYFGPVIGSFTGIRNTTSVVGTISLSGFPSFEARFTPIGRAPSP
jgi:hypothetical protein